jgi:hypothetical protein
LSTTVSRDFSSYSVPNQKEVAGLQLIQPQIQQLIQQLILMQSRNSVSHSISMTEETQICWELCKMSLFMETDTFHQAHFPQPQTEVAQL